MRIFRVLPSAFLAGLLVGVGDIIFLAMKNTNSIVGAMLFSIALLYIVMKGLYLYTGRIGSVHGADWALMPSVLIGNFIGSTAVVLLWKASVVFAAADAGAVFDAVSKAKAAKPLATIFMDGILCGVLMQVAVGTKHPLMVVFAIMTFILAGFEHCIADAPYLLVAPTGATVLSLIAVVAGNSIGSRLVYFCTEYKTAPASSSPADKP